MLCDLAWCMASPAEAVVDESWRVQLFIAARDGNLEVTYQSLRRRWRIHVHVHSPECINLHAPRVSSYAVLT